MKNRKKSFLSGINNLLNVIHKSSIKRLSFIVIISFIGKTFSEAKTAADYNATFLGNILSEEGASHREESKPLVIFKKSISKNSYLGKEGDILSFDNESDTKLFLSENHGITVKGDRWATAFLSNNRVSSMFLKIFNDKSIPFSEEFISPVKTNSKPKGTPYIRISPIGINPVGIRDWFITTSSIHDLMIKVELLHENLYVNNNVTFHLADDKQFYLPVKKDPVNAREGGGI